MGNLSFRSQGLEMVFWIACYLSGRTRKLFNGRLLNSKYEHPFRWSVELICPRFSCIHWKTRWRCLVLCCWGSPRIGSANLAPGRSLNSSHQPVWSLMFRCCRQMPETSGICNRLWDHSVLKTEEKTTHPLVCVSPLSSSSRGFAGCIFPWSV